MGYHLSKQNGFIEHNVHNINMVMHDGKRVFSQGFDRESSGVGSVTCEGTIGKDLTDWSITGDIVQDGIPDVDNPVDIKMVGNKTYNLADSEKLLLALGWTKTGNEYRGNTSALHSKFNSKTADGFAMNPLGGVVRIAMDIRSAEDINSMVVDFLYDDGTYNYAIIGKSYGEYTHREVTSTYGKNCIKTGFSYATSSNVVLKNLQITVGEDKKEYEPYGYKVPVMTMGKNLAQDNTGNRMPIFLKKGNEYVSSSKNYTQFYYYDSDGKQIDYWTMNQEDLRETTGRYYRKFIALKDGYFIMSNVKGGDFQVTEYSGDLENDVIYEPYKEPINTNIYLPTPLAKTEVLRSNGERDINYITFVLDSSTPFTMYSYDGKQHSFQYMIGASNTIMSGFCSHYTPFTRADQIGTKDGVYLSYTASIIITDLRFDTAEEFNEWLKDNPITVVGLLRVPRSETVKVPQIPTFRNEEKTILGTTTIITTDTEVKPSQIDASYKSNAIEYVTLTDDTGNVTKMRKSDYDDLKTNEFLDILEVM